MTDTTNTPDPYPELEKLRQVSEESRTISSFMEWAEYKGYRLVRTHEEDGATFEFSVNVEQAMAEYFEIDMAKVEAERRELLAKVRRTQAEAEAAGA